MSEEKSLRPTRTTGVDSVKRKKTNRGVDWVVVNNSSQNDNKAREVPFYIGKWSDESYLNQYFDDYYKEFGNPSFLKSTEHFMFIGTTSSYVLKFRYHILKNNKRKYSKKVDKWFWSDSKRDLGSVMFVDVLISGNYNASSSFPVIVCYESRDIIMWRNNFYSKPYIRFRFDIFKPKLTVARFLLDDAILFDIGGEKFQVWDFQSRTLRDWKTFIDPLHPQLENKGSRLCMYNFSGNIAYFGLVNDNKIQIYEYLKKIHDSKQIHQTNVILNPITLLFQKPTDFRFHDHQVVEVEFCKLRVHPFFGILENHNFYFFKILNPDPKKVDDFSEKRVVLLSRIIFNESFSKLKFAYSEFLIWSKDGICIFNPFQDYINILDLPTDYPGILERVTENNFLFFEQRNGEFLNFLLFDEEKKMVIREKKDDPTSSSSSENQNPKNDENELKFRKRDGVCIISEDDSITDSQISGLFFGNKFHMDESLRNEVFMTLNDNQDTLYTCGIFPIIVKDLNIDYQYLVYPKYLRIESFDLVRNMWSVVLDLETSQTLNMFPIEHQFPIYISGLYYYSKENCLLVVSKKYIYLVDISKKKVKRVISSKSLVGLFSKKLEFPNIYVESSCKILNHILLVGEERSIIKTPTQNQMIIADSLCIYTFDLEKRNIMLLENMDRNEIISKSTNKKFFGFKTAVNLYTTMKLYVVVDQYPYIFEKNGKTWVPIDIPFVEEPKSEEEMEKEDEIDEEFMNEEEIEGESNLKNEVYQKKGLRIKRLFVNTACKTPASILFFVEASTPRYRQWNNPYVFEYSITHQKWKRPVNIESVTLAQVLSASKASVFSYKRGIKRVILFNETAFKEKSKYERDIICVNFGK